jgi:hypothetical protein
MDFASRSMRAAIVTTGRTGDVAAVTDSLEPFEIALRLFIDWRSFDRRLEALRLDLKGVDVDL